MSKLVTISVKLPRLQEVTPEAAKMFLSTLTSLSSVSPLQKLFGTKPQVLSLELVTINQQILFLITVDEELERFVQTQLQSNYPLVIMQKIEDPLEGLAMGVKNLKLKNSSYYPILTYDKFLDVDTMASILSILSKTERNEVSILQLALAANNSSWQSKGASFADFGAKKSDGTYTPRSDKQIIVDKISYPGFKVSIRVASTTNRILTELAESLGVFTRPDGNSIITKEIGLFSKGHMVDDLFERKVVGNDIMNIKELATIWHL